MSVRSRLRAFDRRHREKGWYVTLQLFMVSGLLSVVSFYSLVLVFAPGLVVELGMLNIAAAIVLFFPTPTPGYGYYLFMVLLAIPLVFWRYRRLYRKKQPAE